MKLDLFDYKLSPELIAQQQVKPRDSSRLMILDRQKQTIEHKHFYDLPEYLTDNDVLVVNQTKVFPARLYGQKKTGGKVEVLLTENIEDDQWQAMIGGRNLNIDDIIYFDKKLEAQIIKNIDGKTKQIKFNKSGQKLNTIIDQIGHTPIPPYIKVGDNKQIKQDYQTIYAKERGSAAAPTAGLHFTEQTLKQLKEKGVKIFKVTLHVSLGTFAPVETEDITKHQIHHEWASIDEQTVVELNKIKKQGKNIIAVGTTSARTLEAFADKDGKLNSGSKWVDIYIYPSYKYRFVDELITNFHLPKSSLLFMVSALASRKFILKAYQKAIHLKYRFFSFGDAMFITKDRL
ncbi:tRNA preQ1(34) S-adenosylmethionine ribosyltransferase-isomerase QueA [Candidatus Parcubacteria bacterium]|jgi:S-adenosylmethionine:tRNA ribosyltransferase-isomerase|nr:tRNA preQ1(34) S-adenosylmethionine ribosyltransferase-isomerase QueA [Candidatus Parcubacteria bacterium]